LRATEKQRLKKVENSRKQVGLKLSEFWQHFEVGLLKERT
jgi:hypothetical protein